MKKDCELTLALGYPPRERREALARPRSVPVDPQSPPTPEQLERRRRVQQEVADFVRNQREREVKRRQLFFDAERRFITDYLAKVSTET